MPVQSVSPNDSTLAENADAMGVDADHFDSLASLAQSIPPVYSPYVYGYGKIQMMMHVLLMCYVWGADHYVRRDDAQPQEGDTYSQSF